MDKPSTTAKSKLYYHRFVLVNLTVLLMACAVGKWAMTDMGAAGDALVLPNYLWTNLGGPPLKDPANVRNEAEMKKFNLIWYYLANVTRAQEVHQHQYDTPQSFLAACHGFDDYIYSLHQMIYASHALDVHTLNGIFPDLGDRFQKSWVRGANLMVSACISGSHEKFMRSKAASTEWFQWYDANSVAIEEALRKAI